MNYHNNGTNFDARINIYVNIVTLIKLYILVIKCVNKWGRNLNKYVKCDKKRKKEGKRGSNGRYTLFALVLS